MKLKYIFTEEGLSPKRLFRVVDCTHEEKVFEGFTQNGCYGNQPHPFEIVFYSSDANTSRSFTKQDFTFQTSISRKFLFHSLRQTKAFVNN